MILGTTQGGYPKDIDIGLENPYLMTKIYPYLKDQKLDLRKKSYSNLLNNCFFFWWRPLGVIPRELPPKTKI